MLLEPVFHDLQGLLPLLTLVEDALITDPVGHDHDAAACSVLADNTQRHDKCWPQRSLAVATVTKLELEVVKLELVELCCVLRPISSAQLVQTLKVIEVDSFPYHILRLSAIAFLCVADYNSVLLFIAIGGL